MAAQIVGRVEVEPDRPIELAIDGEEARIGGIDMRIAVPMRPSYLDVRQGDAQHCALSPVPARLEADLVAPGFARAEAHHEAPRTIGTRIFAITAVGEPHRLV